MALTLYRNVHVQLSKDTALTKLVGEQKLEAKKDSSNHAEGHSVVKIVANGASDEELTMAGVTNGKFLRIESDQPISIKLSGVGNTAIVLNVPSTDIVGSFEATVDFTSVHISNGSGADANIHAIIAGD